MSALPHFKTWKELYKKLLPINAALLRDSTVYQEFCSSLADWLLEKDKLPYLAKRNHAVEFIREQGKKINQNEAQICEVLGAIFHEKDVVDYMMNYPTKAAIQLREYREHLERIPWPGMEAFYLAYIRMKNSNKDE